MFRHIPLPARYLLVGGSCALVHNIVVIAGDAIGVPYTFTVTASTLGVGGMGYMLHSHLTFRAAPRWSGYGRYLMGMMSGVVITMILLAFLHDLLALPMLIASPATTVVTTLTNFIASRWAITARRTGAAKAF
ncbi:MAG TPA: GtrA family protein [Sphingobium sp.]